MTNTYEFPGKEDVRITVFYGPLVGRGTDSANTTVPDAAGVAPTAAEIKTEVEQAGSSVIATRR